MKDTVDMAREAGIIHPEMVLNNLKAFEALVRADERDKWMERAWVGLTDEDDIDWEEGDSLIDLFKAIENKLKDKNT